MPEIRIVDTPDAVSRAAAEDFIALSRAAVDARGVFTVALAGGSTPRHFYQVLADDPALRVRVPWQDIEFFWGDERHVPPDHPDSNYRMARDAMLSKVPVPAARVHRVMAEHPNAARAAADYEAELRSALEVPAGQLPRFDLILLGMGPDGHTASLFPGTAALEERTRLVVENWVEKIHTYRITMTFPVLNAAACVAFLVCGEEKAGVLGSVLGENPNGTAFPAQLVRPAGGRLIWLLDRAAARYL